jgi:3-phosphoshikimate 1-carboxyvinyltransferase
MKKDKINACTVSWKQKPLKATVHLPASKSISNRILIMEALSGKKFPVKNISEADDTKLLRQLLSSKKKILDAGNAGTCFRFLTAYLAQKEGDWIFTGSERMKQRPVGELVNALHQLGAEIKYLDRENFPPLGIHGKKLNSGELEIDSSQSSQFASALLLTAPSVKGGLKLNLAGTASSTPYIDMTLRLMNEFGIKMLKKNTLVEIPEQEYHPAEYSVEADWSAAAFWYAMAALSNNADITLKGLTADSIQGDSILPEWMELFNVETHFIKDGAIINHHKKPAEKIYAFNFSQHPDLAPALFVMCAALGVEARFSGLKNLTIKESSRAEALKTEMQKHGAEIIRVNDDEYGIRPHPLTPSPEGNGAPMLFDTYGDHRLAMAFAMLAIPLDRVEIKNPAVVSKSYPGFWDDLRSAGFEIYFT